MSDPVPSTPGSWHEALREVSERLRQPTESLRQLLQDVVARAVAAVGAAEGSILVPDAEPNYLRFLVSHSPKSTKLASLRVPVSGSIAGYVFGTGQMMAVGDIAEEHSVQFYAEIDREVGVATRTYLVVPIVSGSRVGGVATYVNRPTPPPYQPFQQHEMEEARGFAALEAVLLCYLGRTRQLAEFTANDLATASAALSPGAPAGPAVAAAPEAHADPLVQALQQMEHLPEEAQALCADFIGLIARRYSRIPS